MAGDDRLFKDSPPKIDRSMNGDGFFRSDRTKFELAVKQMQAQVPEASPVNPKSSDGIRAGSRLGAQDMPLSDGDALVQEALALLQDGRQSEGMELLRRGAELQQQAILQRPDPTGPRRLFMRPRRRANRNSASMKRGL
jgi:hypothetical protein